MREIKFRVWDKLDERFTYPNSPFKYHHVLYLDGSYQNLQNGVGGKEVVVQQYTGLKDKNDKEIYEGDILKCEPRVANWICKWSDVYGCWVFRIRDDDMSFHIYYPEEHNWEVIGNIFENPQLVLDIH